MSPGIMLVALSIIIVVVLGVSGVKFARVHERFVVFRLGRVAGVRGPGLTFVLFPIEKAIRVDLRGASVGLGRYTYEAADGREVRYSGQVAWRVVDPVKSVIQVHSVSQSVAEDAEDWLESTTSGLSYGDVASRKRQLEEKLAASLRKELPKLGLELSACEITDIRQASRG